MSAAATSDADRPWLRKYPPGVPAHLDHPRQMVPEMLEESVRRWPERAALRFSRSQWSYRRLEAESERFAAALAREGVGPGDRVALCLPNCPAHPIALLGALRLGATVCQLSPLWIGEDLEAVLRDAAPKVVVTLETLYPILARTPSGPAIPLVYVARLREFYPAPVRPFVNLAVRRHGFSTRFPAGPNVRAWRRAVRTPGACPIYRGDPATTVAVLQYTGGTTGTPKAAMLTHRNLLANVRQANAWNTTRRLGEEVYLAAIPLFHIYGLTVALLLALAEGGTVVLELRPDPAEILRLIQRYRPTQFPGVPALYRALLERPDVGRYRLSSIRYCVSGSAALPAETARRFERATGGQLVEGYGLTEASPVTHANPVQGERRPGSIGLPLPDTDQRIVEADGGLPLPPGEVGELEVRGPQVMLGYYGRPEETAAVLCDGWLRTGDLARVDPDGYAYLVDRKKDLINVGGLKVYPLEVERVLGEHPGVAEAAVVGVPDAAVGEVPRAFVVRAPGATVTAEELAGFVRERLAHYKVPRSFEFRESLPKSGIQKLLRRQLRGEPSPTASR